MTAGVQPPVASPCTGICTLDAADRCTGCHRTLDEIARWSAMDEAERRMVTQSGKPSTMAR